jgi:RNA polymerase sigma factor (sigma-70 family)
MRKLPPNPPTVHAEPEQGPGGDTASAWLSHRPRLTDMAATIVGCRASAEDIVQDAYLRASDFAARESVATPVGLLFRTVRNLALDFSRHRALERRHKAGAQAVEGSPATEPGPEAQTLRDEQVRIVERVLAELPEDCRRAFKMHRVGGYTHEEIAAALGISASMVDKHIRRAMLHCRDWLRKGNQS